MACQLPPNPGPEGLPGTEPASASARVRQFFAVLGPGLITGAADDDPSGISTYSVAGAALGYAPLWTALFSFPLMAAVQLMCARLGLVSGRGLAGALRPPPSPAPPWGARGRPFVAARLHFWGGRGGPGGGTPSGGR